MPRAKPAGSLVRRSLWIDKNLDKAIEKYADTERRSWSSQLCMLVEEAIQARNANKTK